MFPENVFSQAVVRFTARIAASVSYASLSPLMNMSWISLIILLSEKTHSKGHTLFKAGDELKSLYAIRSGTIKSYTITEQEMNKSPVFTWPAIWWDLTPL